MTPGWLEFTLLALAAYRLVRLIGWDDFPPIAWLRFDVTGMYIEDGEMQFTRPLLAHFLSCPFCTGFWVSIGFYLAWLWEPRPTLYAAAPLALSAVVGLVAKNLDA